MPQSVTGHLMGPQIRSVVHLAHPYMQEPPPSDDEALRAELLGGISEGLKAKDNDPSSFWTGVICAQTIPPTSCFDIDARELLQDWAETSPTTGQTAGSLRQWSADSPSTAYPYAKSMVCQKMQDTIDKVTSDATNADMNSATTHAEMSNKNLQSADEELEMVGLIRSDLEITKDDESLVKALGIFWRGQLRDDSRGSIRKKMEEWYGTQDTIRWWGRRLTGRTVSEGAPGEMWDASPMGREKFGVFAIKGLVDVPGDSKRCAKTLLWNLHQYALEEQKIIVVPKEAWTSRLTDLTEYYVSLGFEKVAMANGAVEMVYRSPSASAEDILVEDRAIMVGFDDLGALPFQSEDSKEKAEEEPQEEQSPDLEE